MSATLRTTLDRLGWDDSWAATYAAHDAAASATDEVTAGSGRHAVGRVCRADLRSTEVLLAADDGPHRVTCEWAPRLARAVAVDPTALPAAGDWVVVAEVARARSRLQLEAVLPRRTAVVRAQAGGTSHGQVLAANADVAALVEGMVPDLDAGRLERLLALAWSSGARPLVVLTKADLAVDADAVVRRVERMAPGAEVLAVATTLDVGLAPLRGLLDDGATIALLGASGVGKSTLLNALVAGDPVAGPMATRALGFENKGRHTTVTRELHLGPRGGAVVDTPGMRSVGLAAGTTLDTAFADVEALAATCRFTDCGHATEPGCAVLTAVERGDLSPRRLESWRRLGREQAHQAARTDRRLAEERRRHRKAVVAAYRRTTRGR